MSQVKLIVHEGYGGKYSAYTGEGAVIDLGIRVPDTHDILAVVRSDFDVEQDGSKRSNDAIDPVVRYEKINNLVGRLVTLVDSMFSDPEQRKAAKDLFTQTTWNWYQAQVNDFALQTWRDDKASKH